MTVSEYAKIEEDFKKDNLGKYIDYDGEYGGQCWDLAEYYFVNYLHLPASILAGCGLVSNMLVPPKLNELLEYFDEVDIHNMIKGDITIWNYGHIAIFDNCPDGYTCYFVSQNPNPTDVIPISQNGSRAFRLKGIVPDPSPTPEPTKYIVKEGDTLWDICVKFYGDGTKYAEVATKNGITNPDLIYPGQVIYL